MRLLIEIPDLKNGEVILDIDVQVADYLKRRKFPLKAKILQEVKIG